MKTMQRRKSPKKKKKRRPKSITRRNLKNLLRFLPVMGPLVISAFIYAWQHTRITIVTLPIENLRIEKRDLIKQNDSIRLRIEQLQAPARIESIARKKRGMVLPENWQVVAVEAPLQPPAAAVELSHRADRRFPSSQESAGILGFLKKREDPGSVSQKHTPSETTGQSG